LYSIVTAVLRLARHGRRLMAATEDRPWVARDGRANSAALPGRSSPADFNATQSEYRIVLRATRGNYTETVTAAILCIFRFGAARPAIVQRSKRKNRDRDHEWPRRVATYPVFEV